MMAMKRWIRKVGYRRLGVLLAAVAGAAVVAAIISCCHMQSGDPSDRRPLRDQGVPVIRVRVISRPVRSAIVSTSGPCTIRSDGRELRAGRGALSDARVTLSPSGAWRISGAESSGATLEIAPDDGGRVTLDDVEYRGWIRLVATSEGFYAVNGVDLESYLAGVLPKEIYSHWFDQTYEAQAIAARTFALYKIETYGRGRAYDLTNTQSSQVYGGLSAETNKAWRAIRNTHGKVLAYGAPGEELKVILAHYSSCCGGTVNTARVLRPAADIPPLQGGQRCEDCRGSTRYAWAPVTVSKRELFRCLSLISPDVAALKGLARIEIVTRTPYGLPLWVDLVGPGPSAPKARVRYNDIRSALQRGRSAAADKLHSMNCRLRDRGTSIEFTDGHGFGHGVGLCQWGAQGKAQRGWSSSRILKFYYPGITIHQAY